MNRREHYIFVANELLKELQEHSDETDAQLSARIARRLEEAGQEEYKILADRVFHQHFCEKE